ncbi:MAG: pantoate--beta-alanine ligase [Dehalococcoidia bacterium]|nr:pantoate--beta-alanine ligase [Dehalococcoidia bacterium]
MEVLSTVAAMQSARAATPGSVALVPTMGCLHEGHLALVRRARAENEHVVVSIFVNPTQFGPQEDFERYPRDPERDLRLLAAERVDAVFMPTVEEMYPPGFDEWVELRGPLTERLEGAARPGHFRGVATVVARLFRIVQPHRAYFGEKDAQQLQVIRRLVRELHLPVEILSVPTVREPDGLAMSSRNAYLSAEERRAALALSRSLRAAERLLGNGVTDAETLRRAARDEIAREPGVRLEYVSVSDGETFEELEQVERPARLLVAARAGRTRLIDNALLAP